MDEQARKLLRFELMKEASLHIMSQPWHWFCYHFTVVPTQHPFANSLIDACLDCETRSPGLGMRLIRDVGGIGGIAEHEPHYDQLMQKLAEILVIRRVLYLPWPHGTTFEHEPAFAPGGKRPELRVVTPTGSYLFEVKAPSLTAHQRNRAINGVQAPTRMLDREMLDSLASATGLTLPRDNPIKDFLLDADQKFAAFKHAGPVKTILVIVWDDHIYEPISVLTHEQCGLLTANSYLKSENGEAIIFKNVDAVVLVRHLMYFKHAAGNVDLVERNHAFDYGDEQSLPNIFVPVPGGEQVPSIVRDGLRARPLDDPLLRGAAEYRPLDLVFWLGQ